MRATKKDNNINKHTNMCAGESGVRNVNGNKLLGNEFHWENHYSF